MIFSLKFMISINHMTQQNRENEVFRIQTCLVPARH